jgi:hypothetical protein
LTGNDLKKVTSVYFSVEKYKISVDK